VEKSAKYKGINAVVSCSLYGGEVAELMMLEDVAGQRVSAFIKDANRSQATKATRES